MRNFIKFGFRNVGSFGNKWTELFFGGGLTRIGGENGAGKSTLLECLFFAMYGKPWQRETMAELISWQNGKAGFEVAFWMTNLDATYKVWRTMTDEKLFRVAADGAETEVTGFEGKTAFQREVDRMIGIDEDTARRILFISADDTKPFPELKAADKRQFIEDYFRLGIVGIMEGIAKNRRTALQSSVTLLSRSIAQNEPNLAFLRTKVGDEEQRIIAAVAALTNERRQSDTRMDDAREKFAAELNGCEQSVSHYEKQLLLVSSNEATYLETIETEAAKLVSDAEAEAKRLDVSIDATSKANDELTQAIVDDTSATEAEVNTIIDASDKEKVKVVQELEYDKAAIALLVQDIEKTGADIDVVFTKIDELVNAGGGAARIAVIDMRMSDIRAAASKQVEKKKFLESCTVCPECNNEITEEHRQAEIEKLRAERGAMQAEMKNLEEERAALQANAVAADDARSELHSLRNVAAQLADRHRKAEQKIAGSTLWLSGVATQCDAKITDARRQQQMRTIKRNAAIVDVDIIVECRRQLLENAKAKAATMRAEAVNEFAKAKAKAEQDLAVAKIQLDNKTAEWLRTIDALTEAHAVLTLKTVDTSSVEVTRKQLAQAEATHAKFEADLSTAEYSLKISESSCFVVGDKGAKKYFIGTFVPVLNKKVAELLKWFALPVHIEFDDQLNMKMLNLSSPKEVKYRQHSKGERRRITVAILLSFIEIVSEMMGWQCDQMFFDEFLDDGTDAKGMEDLIGILTDYSERRDCGIVVVSHKAKGEYFDRDWFVAKTEGFSNVTVKA